MFSRRFYHLQGSDASLSSRFGGLPALMEREPSPISNTVRYTHTPFNPHLILPPISYKRFGIKTPKSNTSSQQSLTQLPFRRVVHNPGNNQHHSVLDHLLSTLPDETDSNYPLPESPIVITEDQEAALLLETNCQLAEYDIVGLRDLYMALTQIDAELTGCVSYGDLLLTFQRKQIPITEQLLRLISAQFVSRREDAKVNYERVLSFIGAAMKINRTRNESDNFASRGDSQRYNTYRHQPSKIMYYHDNSCQNTNDHKDPNDVFTERDDPVLLRLLENSIRHQFTPINLESLRIAFQRSDRLHRGTLSEQQIKDLCFQHDVRIDDSILERIVHRCKERGGGQYDWQQFIRYLERVQPVQTSLNITGSRRPRDYQMHFPHPSSSWPQAESPSPWGSPLHRHVSPILPLFKNRSSQSPQHRELPPPLAPKATHEVQTLNLSEEDDEEMRPLQIKLNQLEDEVQHLTERKEILDIQSRNNQSNSNYINALKSSSYDTDFEDKSTVQQPWFDRFMEAADQFYRSDINSSGVMPPGRIIELMDKLNIRYKLKLKRVDIESALISARRSSGMIDINDFLKFLASKN